MARIRTAPLPRFYTAIPPRLRTFAALVLGAVTTGACASSPRTTATVNAMDLAGVWEFDVQLDGSIRGTVTLTGNDRYVVRCIDDFTPALPPALLQQRAGAVEFRACGATFRVRREEDGRVTAEVTKVIRRPYTVQGPCVETRTYTDGTVRCVRYENEIRYRDQTLRTRVELEAVVSMGG
ncbi:MAG: hypothetical protein KJO11_08525 [Gemmatimonadetes bacterium]|nr:hypothetical protein [Gemmatimonadota bacterium]MBT8402369.1 hypothetical protein [Gemmatimonadota bacterium]